MIWFLMHLPDFLEPYKAAGQKLLSSGAVKGVVFSGPTYQVEVRDPALTDPLWVFLQFDQSNQVKDLFCSCEESTEKGACSHMAAAYFYVVPRFLHFEASFWHALFFQMQEKIAPNMPKAKREGNSIDVHGLFTAQGPENFCQLFQTKPEETEETSIKFSNLSEEEIERWRLGHPSLALSFELSFLSDVAKWFFIHGAKVTIEGSTVTITAPGVTLTAKNVDVKPLIPTLNTVSANVRLIDERELSLKRLEYDPKTASFIFHKGPKKSIDGFVVPAGSDESLFTNSLDLLKQHFTVDETLHELHYSISVDKAVNVEAYLAEPGDLDDAPLWGDWTYFKGRFIRLAPRKFHDLKVTLSSDEIMANRYWLSQFPGFYVHVARLEEQILYEVSETGSLTFRSVLQKLPRTKQSHELGDWIYVAGDGFYVKNFTDENPPLSFGREIPPHLVAEYIRHHLELLQSIPDFFTDENPLAGVGLKVWLKKKGTIEIIPQYEWRDITDSHNSFFYDEFIFVKQKGFYRLPLAFRPVHLVREVSAADPQAWSDFFQELLPKLKEEYHCTIDPRLERAEKLALTMESKANEPERLSECKVDVSWEAESGTIALKELIAAKKKQVRYLPTDAGVIDLSEDRFRWLDTVKDRRDLVLRSSDFLRITAYDTIHVHGPGRFKELLEKLLLQKPTEPIELSSLTSDLRPYQKNGVEWLWFLYQNDLSGLLCDDMGVGKTHQAMGLMDGVRNYQRKNGKKSLFLVVCPTSLIYHWQEKLERYLPSFKTKVYVGTDRSLEDFEGDYDILLTTYGIWRNESKKFLKYLFDAAFFDELQIAKNHVSQIHNALLQVQAPLKVGLTGTPIENHLRELKALFDLVLPGYMPHDGDYREFFIRPIERGDTKRRELMSRFVKPFVLRRRKQDVLPDLPVKTEDFAFAELAPEQKSLYKTVASQQAEPLIRQLRDESAPIPFMHIFAVLSALKQICNHPAAYLKDIAHFESYESGKWDAFVELIEEAMESEQKVVVFSQFLAMLDIMGLYFQKRGIGYAEIRGQTKNRGDEVQRFHNDPNCRVFLGSLQAAGLGIDLTPASIVIHYDRWWNAARENQATDRVHRIGQVRGVQVFKLLTKNTIEERIDQLIVKKSNLLEDVVFFDDHQIVKRLSRSEIISLLQGLPD
ncbi:MAG: DEAD/DEAH box helicase [Verrucomicrobia bacterium]|nr:DEAD/DEAH box helicase [Verrucomicrobiota bacterium]MBS0635874.1 DEAD/DEAH box helicase [Verrucomicrobiota bacterium]